jgi:hypothetical protein
MTRWAPARRPDQSPGRTYNALNVVLAPNNAPLRRASLISNGKEGSERLERPIISHSVAKLLCAQVPGAGQPFAKCSGSNCHERRYHIARGMRIQKKVKENEQ